VDDLGTHYGASLYAREVRYLVDHEWARSAEDILWRRTKQGLYLQDAERALLETDLANMLQQRPLELVSSRA
jgi:glycerol-3-phosphate dehydrogenase